MLAPCFKVEHDYVGRNLRYYSIDADVDVDVDGRMSSHKGSGGYRNAIKPKTQRYCGIDWKLKKGRRDKIRGLVSQSDGPGDETI